MRAKGGTKMERREFLKTMATAGLGSALAGAKGYGADSNEPNAPAKEEKIQITKVPRRKLGKTGVEVPILALGFGGAGESVVLNQSLDWGVNQWDTSLVAAGGNSETSIGQFIAKNPERRKEIFIVTKENESKNAADLEKCLQTSLKRLNTSYVDLYFGVYRMAEPAQLTDEVKNWAKGAKDRGLVKFFGFSTHKNMERCLSAAAKLDWIDAIQFPYNFRLMQGAEMQAAVDACNKAGIGLIAMKTQGMGQNVETEGDKKLIAHFLQKGFTEGQAKIKAVLEDQRISAVCSAMGSSAMLMTNIAAVLDKTKLAQADMDVLREYAAATCSGYCAGCAEICESALSGVPVSDIMRYLMYYNSYGDTQRARELFAQLPANVKNRLISTDYSVAEARCPQHLPIGKLIAEAVTKLA